MSSEDWKPRYARWARIYAMSLLLSPLVWAILIRPPDEFRDVWAALLITFFLGWPWIVACLLIGTVVVTRFSRVTADVIAVLAALAVAFGTTQVRMMAG